MPHLRDRVTTCLVSFFQPLQNNDVQFQPCDPNGGYEMTPDQYQEQQPCRTPSAPVQYSASPALPPPENPYQNPQADGSVQGGWGEAAGGDHGILRPVLPYGWESKALPEGRTLFIDHNTQVSNIITADHTAGTEIDLSRHEGHGRSPSCCFSSSYCHLVHTKTQHNHNSATTVIPRITVQR